MNDPDYGARRARGAHDQRAPGFDPSDEADPGAKRVRIDPIAEPELHALLEAARSSWRPTPPSRPAEFQRRLDRRIRRRRVRNGGFTAIAAASVAVLVLAVTQRDQVDLSEPVPVATGPSALAEAGPAPTFEPAHGSAPASSEGPREPASPAPGTDDRVAAVVGGDGTAPAIGPSEADIWFSGALGAPPDPRYLPDEYGVLGQLYAHEVGL